MKALHKVAALAAVLTLGGATAVGAATSCDRHVRTVVVHPKKGVTIIERTISVGHFPPGCARAMGLWRVAGIDPLDHELLSALTECSDAMYPLPFPTPAPAAGAS